RRLPRRHPRPGDQKRGPAPGHDQLVELSSNEIRHLLTQTALAPTRHLASIPGWSTWRRHRQHQTRLCHHHHRGHRPP
ncbi:MAG TPA: hypothetical protein VGJ13_20745, partial [Pseudonocardiaceae bacterium]